MAVKLFSPEHRHFAERELHFGEGLKHANLNPIEQLLDLGDYTALLMPFVAGKQLGHFLDQSPKHAFLQTFMGVLAGLGYFHDLGYIHRDVKPENIIVDRSGQPRLLDFDLATHTGEAFTHRSVAGTLAYMSPEQAFGDLAGTTSDLYAAGIILYRALTGEVPFTGSASEVARAHREDSPLPPSHFDGALKAFDHFFEALLAKRPENRFQSAEAVMERLEILMLTVVADD